jgi:putative Mg2+ transporter-C (MgtC) family protein
MRLDARDGPAGGALTSSLSALDFGLRIFVALALGSIIGLERQWRQRLAGLRTNALVATGASLFVSMTALVGSRDSTQIVAYVVSGIGFLAGGVIFKERSSVSGLNTAATLWCTAAIGALVGLGFVLEALVGVAAVLTANIVLRPIAARINRQPVEGSEVISSYEVRVVCGGPSEAHVRGLMIATVRAAGAVLTAVYSEDIAASEQVEVIADVSLAGRPDERLEQIVTQLGGEPDVAAASWRVVPTTEDERAVILDT